MISAETGTVEKIIWSREGIQCLEVKIGDKKEKALNYPFLTGTALPGHCVLLNTTAVNLGLGSGGYHFVMANYALKELSLTPGGHIMKLRYTPLQCKVQVYEELLDSRGSALAWNSYEGLKGLPVVIGELHSMVAPYILAMKKLQPGENCLHNDRQCCSAYLPERCRFPFKTRFFTGRDRNLRPCFRWRSETVNVYTALMAARMS